jgi:hypothetical protein
MSDGPELTHVTLFWRKGKREDWLKFGKPVADRIVSRSERIESYAAGQVFGLVRWASNDYGTIRSTLDIVRAVDGHEPCTPVPQVDPGGDVLLSVHGWPKVAQVFRLIDAIEARASTLATLRPIIGDTSTTGWRAAKCRAITAPRAIAPGSSARRCCHDAAGLHPGWRRRGRHTRDADRSGLALRGVERDCLRADRALRHPRQGKPAHRRAGRHRTAA